MVKAYLFVIVIAAVVTILGVQHIVHYMQDVRALMTTEGIHPADALTVTILACAFAVVVFASLVGVIVWMIVGTLKHVGNRLRYASKRYTFSPATPKVAANENLRRIPHWQ